MESKCPKEPSIKEQLDAFIEMHNSLRSEVNSQREKISELTLNACVAEVQKINPKEGEKLQVYIESIDVQKRKISLGIVETNKKNVIYK